MLLNFNTLLPYAFSCPTRIVERFIIESVNREFKAGVYERYSTPKVLFSIDSRLAKTCLPESAKRWNILLTYEGICKNNDITIENKQITLCIILEFFVIFLLISLKTVY